MVELVLGKETFKSASTTPGAGYARTSGGDRMQE